MDKPSILLHICCAPDSTAVFERLRVEYEIQGYFHNDNIHPPEEYARRSAEAGRVAQILGFRLVPADYDPASWERAVAGLEKEPERGARCEACFLHNLTATAHKAGELGIAFFATTLTISPHKQTQQIFQAGRIAANAVPGVSFLEMDFKKKGGFGRSLELSKHHGLYRQNYCGCRFSTKIHA